MLKIDENQKTLGVSVLHHVRIMELSTHERWQTGNFCELLEGGRVFLFLFFKREKTLQTGQVPEEIVPPSIHLHKQSQQYKWPHIVTTGFFAVSKQILQSNFPFDASLIFFFLN